MSRINGVRKECEAYVLNGLRSFLKFFPPAALNIFVCYSDKNEVTVLALLRPLLLHICKARGTFQDIKRLYQLDVCLVTSVP